ncbi:MAG: SCP2 sterol-binding domain-containing protein [Promethearchaeota archaeon]|nr:MAG: SCP2 sterol-binding domain-containing protein [Candidatus Lokiarchaeota archaeon]
MDENLIKEVSKIMEGGMEGPEDILILNELFKQASSEIEDLKEELADINQFVGQMIISDKDFKWWVKMGDGVYDFNKGEAEDPSFTMSANWETMSGMMIGEIDGTSAYMSGDLQIEGDLQNTIAYGDYLGLVADILQEE